MKELIGKIIYTLRMNEDQSVLAFDTDRGVIAYEACGGASDSTRYLGKGD